MKAVMAAAVIIDDNWGALNMNSSQIGNSNREHSPVPVPCGRQTVEKVRIPHCDFVTQFIEFKCMFAPSDSMYSD